jgi:hypothetical protein
MANQTWDDFLLTLAEDFIPPSLKADLNRRLHAEGVVSGSQMKREFKEWSRRRGSA